MVLSFASAQAAAAAPLLDSVDFALDFFRRGRFNEFDATLDRLAKDDVRMEGGGRASDALIARLGKMLVLDETLVQQLARWRESSTHRPWAELGEASYEEALAWQIRGRGYASSVPPEAWPLFYAHLNAAEAALDRALKIAPDAREPRATRVSLALARGLPFTEVVARFNEALRVDPVSPEAHDAMFLALTPKWGGTPDLLLTFARDAGRREPDDPYLALLIVNAHNEIVGSKPSMEPQYYHAPGVWAEVSGAVGKFLAKYPDSTYGHNLLARLALLCGQREVLRRELAWIGENVDRGVWHDGEASRAREWAALEPVNRGPASPPASQRP